MKSFFKTKRFKALLAIVLVLSGFMVYSITTHGMGTIPSSLVSAVTKPFEQLASWVSGLADDVFGGFVLTSQLKEQVASMEEEIRTLREQQVDYAQIKSENEELRQYLDLKKENPDFVLQDAQVIKRDASDPFASFTISVGSLHGVERGDPVITPDGLVGCVDVVEETQSIVRTVLDNSIGIGAMDSHTQRSGQISANTLTLARDDKCRMNNIKRENAISRGDIIITSGVGKGYPRGLIIGTVEEVLQESDGISNYAIVKPAADVRNVRNVMVIKDFTATPIPDESVTGDGGGAQ